MKNYRNPDWLRKKYVDERLSSTAMAKLEKTGHATILRWLRHFGIKPRTLAESHPLKHRLTKEYLEEEYWKKGKSMNVIGRAHGLCFATVQYWMKKYGIPKRSAVDKSWNIGAVNPGWKGGKYITPGGYRYILTPGHPRKSGGTKARPYIPEQVLVMEKSLGRFLTPLEVVHHKDGVKLNNDISNLQLLASERDHQTYEQGLCLFAKQLLFGAIVPSNRDELLRLFDQFVNERG